MVGTFYTYAYLRKDGSPYYIGKGKGDRVFYSHPGHRPPNDRSRILIQCWSDEATALAYEVYQIDFWGRKDLGAGILRNLTDGGEGTSGRNVLRGRHLSPKTEIKKGMHLSPATEFKKGHTPWKGVFGALTPMFGKHHSEASKRKSSESQKGRGKGRKLPLETKKRMSEAQKRRWEQRKENSRAQYQIGNKHECKTRLANQT